MGRRLYEMPYPRGRYYFPNILLSLLILYFVDEHRYLCSGGKGIIGIDHVTITKDGDKIKIPSSIIRIDECALRPDICGPGECVDTVDGYECRCKPGYRLLSSNICAGID